MLTKCAVPLVIGMGFIEKIKLYTMRKHPMIPCLPNLGSMPMFKFIGSIQSRISFTVGRRSLGQFVAFDKVFHVLPELSEKAIFVEEFLENLDAFNICVDLYNAEYSC